MFTSKFPPLRRLAALSALIALPSLGCSGAQLEPRAPHDEVPIKSTITSGGLSFEAIPLAKRFEEALALAEAGDARAAALSFDRIAELGPGSRYVEAALFNAARCHARLGDHARAAERLEHLRRLVPHEPGAVTVALALAKTYGHLDRRDEADGVLAALLGEGELSPHLRIEALLARSANALAAANLAAAQRYAEQALAYEPSFEEDEGRLAFASWRPRASLAMADALRAEADSLELVGLSTAARSVTLAKRGRIMIAAQRHYLDAMQQPEPDSRELVRQHLTGLYRELDADARAAMGRPDERTARAPLPVDVSAILEMGREHAARALARLDRSAHLADEETALVRAAVGDIEHSAAGM